MKKSKKDKQLENLLFEVYEKGVNNEDCNLTAYIEKLKEALTIPVVSVPKGEQCAHNNEPILDKNGHYECPDCKRYGENC